MKTIATYIKNVHGIKLTYTLTNIGWTYQASGYPDRVTRRKAMSLYPKHCPAYTEHLREKIEQERSKMMKAILELPLGGGE